MKIRRLGAAIALLGGLVWAGPAGASDRQPPVLVFAAASVSDSVQAVGAAFTRKTGVPVRVSSGGSGGLAQQIVRGAPADVFISAGAPPMATLLKYNLVDADSSFEWISNRLVVVAPADRARPLVSDDEIVAKKVKHLALGEPSSVPAGMYARQALVTLGLWDRLQGRLVPATDVRAALAYVESGEADLGIVFATDARLSARVKVVYWLPEESHAPIAYPAALVANLHRAPGTLAFLEFLRGPETRRILVDAGFTPAFP